MGKPALTLVIKNYDFLAPLACGDVVAEDLDLRLDRDTAGAIDRTASDPSIQAGELSLSRHLLRISRGDNSFVGIPFFPTRNFRHRCFFVRRDSGLRSFNDLVGKRVGTTEWPATGNTWSRAAIREAGVELDQIRWLAGSIEGPPSGRAMGTLPPYVELAPTGQSLRELLIKGELDALMCPIPPSGFYEPDSPIVRLFPDFRRVEQEYFQRTGINPIHHIVGIRREVFDRDPRIARSLFNALDRSKLEWQRNRRRLADTTPWLLAEIEDATAMMGDDWRPSGTDVSRKVVQALCDEQLAQGLVDKPLDATAAFAEFDAVMRG